MSLESPRGTRGKSGRRPTARRGAPGWGGRRAVSGVPVVVIDNYDSFTYNLVQLLGELGARPVVYRNDALTVDELAAMRPSHVVISPGPCTPREAGISVELVRRLEGTRILGVCLGHQAIGEAFGAKVVRAPVAVHGKASPVWHDGKGIFRRAPEELAAGRYHSLVVERESLPPVLEVSAWTRDGLIMGLRHKERPIEGVQFHPESILTPRGRFLLRNFLKGSQ